MKASVATGGLDTSTARAASLIERLALRGIVASLRCLRRGRVTFVTPSGDFAFGGVEPGPQATVTVHDPHFYSALAFSGNIGAAESYARGEWSADDLIGLVRVMALNWNVFTGLDGWANWLVRPFHRAAHMLRRNTTRGSRRNIGLHYDLSNDFFATFLDPTLSYSAAIFEHDGMTLEQASVAKIDRICRKLRLSPRDHLLEIGTGWGALAMHAATQYGCRVTTTTISREQYRLAGKRIQPAASPTG
jgi:cyclopropane-fatty-acyl-phospholipid synthase